MLHFLCDKVRTAVPTRLHDETSPTFKDASTCRACFFSCAISSFSAVLRSFAVCCSRRLQHLMIKSATRLANPGSDAYKLMRS